MYVFLLCFLQVGNSTCIKMCKCVSSNVQFSLVTHKEENIFNVILGHLFSSSCVFSCYCTNRDLRWKLFLLFCFFSFHTIKQCVAKETSLVCLAVPANKSGGYHAPLLPLSIIQYAFICILFITSVAAARCWAQKAYCGFIPVLQNRPLKHVWCFSGWMQINRLWIFNVREDKGLQEET